MFPLLEGERVIGRVDMRADRGADALEVRRFWLEPGVRWGQGRGGRRERLEAELARLARLAGVSRVEWLETEPAEAA